RGPAGGVRLDDHRGRPQGDAGRGQGPLPGRRPGAGRVRDREDPGRRADPEGPHPVRRGAGRGQGGRFPGRRARAGRRDGLGHPGRPLAADLLIMPGAGRAASRRAVPGTPTVAAVRNQAASVSAGLATRPLQGGRPTPYAVAVLEVVDRIPRGKVMSYGDVAEYVGSGTGRTVGAVMSRHGHEVPWHRVVQSTGGPNPAAPEEALRRLRRDRTPMRGDKVDMRLARWDGR